MSTQTYTATTHSAINSMAAADRVDINIGNLEIGEAVSAVGVRRLVGGGLRRTEYTVTRAPNDRHGGFRYNVVRYTIESI